MSDLQSFSHPQSSNREIGNTATFLEPQYIQTIENAEQTKRTGLDPNSSMMEIIESTQETGQGDMAEPLQGQSPMTYPVHPHKSPMFAFDALTIQEDFFNTCFQQHPEGTVPQDAFPSQYGRALMEESEKDVEHKDLFWCVAANYKTVNNIQQEIHSNFEENIVSSHRPLNLDQSYNSVELVRNPLKKIKSDSSSGLSNGISLTYSMSQPSTEEGFESRDEDEYQNKRGYERDTESIHRNTFSVYTRAKLTQTFELLDKLQSIKEFEISEELVTREADFNFPSSIPKDRQDKMRKEARKAVIDEGRKGVLELLKHPDRGFEFQYAIQHKGWFQGVIQRKEWFKTIFQGQKWYERAKTENKLLDCNHPHDYISYNRPDESSCDESVREECLAMRNLYALLYGMFKHGIDTNGQERFNPRSQRKLYQVIGNKRFSPADDVNEMDNQEFCQKVGSSTLAVFFEKESQFFETYVIYLYESGGNQHKNETTLTDFEKRQMLIASKSSIRKKIFNLKK